jgi:hypothetical protein
MRSGYNNFKAIDFMMAFVFHDVLDDVKRLPLWHVRRQQH